MHFEQIEWQGIGAWIRYPDGYEEGKRYPVILTLHGAGGRELPLENVLNHTFFEKVNKLSDFPFVSIAPHCNENSWFDMFERLKQFVLTTLSQPFCDAERFYLMGASMGGYATWQLAMSMPECFAAIVPICGGGMSWNGARLANVPVWAFHGALDTTVHVEESEWIVARINKNGGNAKLTVYPENAHDSWSDTFANPEVYAWMLSHRNQNEKKLIDIYNNVKDYG
ncbi:MAG: prolyl oligopeptidase family serine peptidase [Clostridia bacterium]|nr:prolyl oligopeptidase family serine peptidase [Clostridia bacterium]